MDVTTPEQAKIAQEAGACAVMALEKIPADIKAAGGVSRMSDPKMINPLKQIIQDEIPVLATCAGLILLSNSIENEQHSHIGTLPVTVKRNAYGRQISSFETNSDVSDINNYPMVFIRAPYITSVNNSVKVLATVDEHIVGVQYNNQIGVSFHPELTSDLRIHEKFINLCK